MKFKQPNLINFSTFQALDLFSGNVKISRNGIVHTIRNKCLNCGETCHYNGSSNKGSHILTCSTNSLFRKGQQYCPSCKKTIQVENGWLDTIIDSMNEFLASQIISLSEQLSEDEIVSHLESTMGIIISKSTVHNVITKSNEDFENLEFEYKIKEGFYGYDEQYIKINGKRAYRIVIYDIQDNKVIYEKIHYKFSKKILTEILKEVFQDSKPKGFVTDMRLEYPSAFKAAFGRKIKVQFCIFHLNKKILKEYRDSLKIGKKVYWTLMDYRNMYLLFDIFYDRSFELKKLKDFMDYLDNFKEKLTLQKVEYYIKKYEIKLKTFEKQKKKVIEIIEKKMMKAFRKMLHDRKNLRKRQKKALTVRSIESAKRKFEKIYDEKNLFPKLIEKRIGLMKEKFEYFIASEGEVLTNNKLEGFFGATLKKFRKKSRKSLLSFSALLKRKRARQGELEYCRKFTIFDLAKIFAVLTIFAQ